MPTALELTREKRRYYIEAIRRKAAAILKNRFGAKKVILFGSLAHGLWFTPKSDIDSAVEGLDADNYWESWRVIERFITDRVVDLVDLETARESLREDIQQYGIIL